MIAFVVIVAHKSGDCLVEVRRSLVGDLVDDADGDGETSTGADDYWDFGTSGQYPVLIVDFDGNGSATWQEFGTQR